MQIMVNGKIETFDAPLTISQYLEYRKLDTKLVVVERNFTVVPREEWERIRLEEGDNLEVIRIIGGG